MGVTLSREREMCYWDGITRVETLAEKGAQLRQALADAAKDHQWPKVLQILSKHPDLVNTTRPGGKSLYAPLHQAAHEGAPLSVVESLLQLGAFRTLRNAEGERPVDIAEKRNHTSLMEVLSPSPVLFVPSLTLSRIQEHFHVLIMERAARLVREHQLRLPELEPLLEFDLKQFLFAVPGMYGGFKYWFAYDGNNAKLIASSWCRVAGGSGRLHEITAQGYTLLDEGFV